MLVFRPTSPLCAIVAAVKLLPRLHRCQTILKSPMKLRSLASRTDHEHRPVVDLGESEMGYGVD